MALHTNSRACETEDALFGSLLIGSTGPLFSPVSAGFHIRMAEEAILPLKTSVLCFNPLPLPHPMNFTLFSTWLLQGCSQLNYRF